MDEKNYGSGLKSYSMTGEEALNFLDGVQNKLTARDYVNEGARLFQLGDFAGAEVKFKEAISANPQNAVAHSNIGNIYYKRKQYQEAIKWLEKALQIDPAVSGVAACLNECRIEIGKKSLKKTDRKWWQFWK
jgi:tetratricopeptide (TPR) repeat protein